MSKAYNNSSKCTVSIVSVERRYRRQIFRRRPRFLPASESGVSSVPMGEVECDLGYGIESVDGDLRCRFREWVSSQFAACRVGLVGDAGSASMRREA